MGTSVTRVTVERWATNQGTRPQRVLRVRCLDGPPDLVAAVRTGGQRRAMAQRAPMPAKAANATPHSAARGGGG